MPTPNVCAMDTADDIAAARIIALGLAGPPLGGPVDVARHLAGIQAQALPGALASIALRTAGRSLGAVAQALADGEIVRSWTQRGTIHLVAATDLGWILDLTAARMLKAAAKRRAQLGIDSDMFDRATTLVSDAIHERGPLTRAELLGALEPIGVGDVQGREYHIITMLAMHQVVVQGPLADATRTEQLFVLNGEWTGTRHHLARPEAVALWMTQYAIGHGPVTAADAVRWSGLTTAEVRAGLSAGIDAGALAHITIDGSVYFQRPDLPDLLAEHRAAAHEVRLLPGFDELILGYRDRTATLATTDEKLVVPGGNGVFKATVIRGAKAVGTWVRSTRRTGPTVVATPFPGRRISARAVEAAAQGHPSFAP